MPRDIGNGVIAETVGDLLEEGRPAPPPPPPVGRLELPTIEDYPHAFPEPGIYFDMPEEVYHAIPALSNGGIKRVSGSPMIYWAKTPWLNPDCEPQADKEHFDIGKAYHCRLLEGTEAFAANFALYLDKADYPDVIETTDEIKNAILKLGEKPATKVPTGEEAPDAKTGEVKPLLRAAKKDDWIEQLLELDPAAQVWDRIKTEYEAEHAGKTMIGPKTAHLIEIVARMFEHDEELSRAFTGGYPEVSLFWYCPATGVPKKARVDYLKVKMMVDLKTFQNMAEKSPDRAINSAIGTNKYPVQPAHYFEGAAEVRKIVREHGASAVHSCGIAEVETARGPELTLEGQALHQERVQFALKWAKHTKPDEWLWVFVMKGPAPIVRGKWFHRSSVTKQLADDVCAIATKKYRRYVEQFGTAPWLDLAPFDTLADEDVPAWALEI